jgi:hypothetical protein
MSTGEKLLFVQESTGVYIQFLKTALNSKKKYKRRSPRGTYLNFNPRENLPKIHSEVIK